MQHRLIGYMRSNYLACTVALVVTLGCGQSSPTDDGLCGGQECRAGEFCISGVCEELCSADGTCSAGFSCRDGICIPVACGDGEVEGSEECDNGVDNDDNGACTRRCEEARCGDGLEFFEQEECDDSNAIDGDGCDSNCTLTACGNGIQTEGEECDDGNTDDTDGCRSDCVFSVCSAATPDGTPCTDDGVFCNGPEVCQQGECVSSGSPCVEDNLSCTTELCDEEAGLCNLIDAESCLVGGTCFDDGERSSVSRCYVCDAARNQSELTTLGDGLGLANPLYANDEGKVAGQACGVGVCAGGVVRCDDNSPVELLCSTEGLAEFETCNYLDDDCDGETDEGFDWDSGFPANDLADFDEQWSSTGVVMGTYPQESSGIIYGRILPEGDVDFFRFRATENDSSICGPGIEDKPIVGSLQLTAPEALGFSNIWYQVCACWSELDATESCRPETGDIASWEDEHCKIAYSGGVPDDLRVAYPAVCLTNVSAYLDVWIRPYTDSLDFSCDDWILDWQISE